MPIIYARGRKEDPYNVHPRCVNITDTRKKPVSLKTNNCAECIFSSYVVYYLPNSSVSRIVGLYITKAKA